jgi:hypothetical protein
MRPDTTGNTASPLGKRTCGTVLHYPAADGFRLHSDQERTEAIATFRAISMQNSIFVIKPYLWNGMWVFDDPAVGLVKEPFVGGMPEMIQKATQHMPGADQGFLAVFSANYFPGASIVLEWVREDSSGNIYRWAETGQEGWLCPALLKYFKEPPAKLYIQVRPAG